MIMTTDKLEYAKTKTQVYTYIVRVTYFLILILSHWDCTLILIHPIPIILHTDTHKKNLFFFFFNPKRHNFLFLFLSILSTHNQFSLDLFFLSCFLSKHYNQKKWLLQSVLQWHSLPLRLLLQLPLQEHLLSPQKESILTRYSDLMSCSWCMISDYSC